MSCIYFTSDQHFFHKNILTYCERPWSTLEEMHEGLIARWNEVVSPFDDVFVLGDFCFGGKDKCRSILERMQGNKHLIIGNHDFRGNVKQALKCGWASVEESGFVQVDDLHIKLSHYPYTGDRGEEERYKERRLKDQGAWLLHGHVHQHWAVNGRQINVGVDVRNYYPISLSAIVDIIKNKSTPAQVASGLEDG